VAAEPPELSQPRLSAATASRLPKPVTRPAYERSRTGKGIVHLGVGAFMRAHVAVYCDDALGNGELDWGIAGVSLRRPDVYQQLARQDCLYTVGIRSAEDTRYRLVGAIKSIDVAPRDPDRVLGLLAAPTTRIVTITVTEKGYCLASASGRLDTSHADIVHDREHPGTPRSLVGYLAEGLRRRRADGAGPVTLLSCDNLPANGVLLKRCLEDYCNLAHPGLWPWIEEQVSFPASMVDRIVPAVTKEDIARTAAEIGVVDAAHVGTEAFSQWVIEDCFRNGRPAWDKSGALFVSDVTPYEKAKLRLLNGAHSSIAYLGYLAGCEYVHEVMANPDLAAFVERLMRESISPVTPEPVGMAHASYIEALLRRFANPALKHRTWQIAMDGSQKLPQRLLGTIRDRIAEGGDVEELCLPVAAWMRYVSGIDEHGEPIEVSDPLVERFAKIAADSGDDRERYVRELLALESIFGKDLGANDAVRATLVRHLASLHESGVLETVRQLNRRGVAE